MSYWSHNPELLDEITIEALPEEWKDMVESGEIELSEVPEKIRDKAMIEGERDYWAGQVDSLRVQLKERRLAMAETILKEEKNKEEENIFSEP